MTPINILVVEDDDVDMMSVERAFKSLNLCNSLERAEDGQKAWDRLVSPDNKLRADVPEMILLDLNMPRMTGAELLKKLSALDVKLDSKVYILTTSDLDQDIIDAHKYGIEGYLLKSDLVESLREIFEGMTEKWMLVK